MNLEISVARESKHSAIRENKGNSIDCRRSTCTRIEAGCRDGHSGHGTSAPRTTPSRSDATMIIGSMSLLYKHNIAAQK